MRANRLGVGSASEGLVDLKRRLQFVLVAIIVFSIESYIPVPGMNPLKLKEMFNAHGIALDPGMSFYLTTTLTLVTGTLFLMWLGEQVTERGIGNGISIIIFSGIVAGLPAAIARTLEQVREGQLQVIALLLI